MRTPFVLTDDGLDVGAVVRLDEDRLHHLQRVLRRDVGAELDLTDGHGHLVPAALLGEGARLGVAEVRPVITDHTESRPAGDRAHAVGARLRAVAESALQQAQSAHLCRVADPSPLDVTLRDPPGHVVALAAHPDAPTTLGARLATVSPEVPIHLLIGPEGGLSERELEALSAAGWTPVRVGSTVLRTVHAATVLAAAAMAFSGCFGDTPS